MKYLWTVLTALALICLCGAALAQEGLPAISCELSQMVLDKPQEVIVSIRVENPYETDFAGPVGLYDPDGRRIESFGTPTLKAGESLKWTGTWMITEDMLQQGRVTFVIVYTVQGSDGTLQTKQQAYYLPITYAQQQDTPVQEEAESADVEAAEATVAEPDMTQFSLIPVLLLLAGLLLGL